MVMELLEGDTPVQWVWQAVDAASQRVLGSV